jgi:hypothetical protein
MLCAVCKYFLFLGLILGQLGLYMVLAETSCPHTITEDSPCPVPFQGGELIREDCGQFSETGNSDTPSCLVGMVSIQILEGPYGSKTAPESSSFAERRHTLGECYRFNYCEWIEGECRKDNEIHTASNYISQNFQCQ